VDVRLSRQCLRRLQSAVFREMALCSLGRVYYVICADEGPTGSSEMSVHFYQTTWCHIPEDSNFSSLIKLELMLHHVHTMSIAYTLSLHFSSSVRLQIFNNIRKLILGRNKAAGIVLFFCSVRKIIVHNKH
jgi:hypothetical protein